MTKMKKKIMQPTTSSLFFFKNWEKNCFLSLDIQEQCGHKMPSDHGFIDRACMAKEVFRDSRFNIRHSIQRHFLSTYILLFILNNHLFSVPFSSTAADIGEKISRHSE